jgi:hypothetical protein
MTQIKTINTTRGSVSETCLSAPLEVDPGPSFVASVVSFDNVTGELVLNGTFYNGQDTHPVPIMWDLSLDPRRTLQRAENNPCIWKRDLHCLSDVARLYRSGIQETWYTEDSGHALDSHAWTLARRHERITQAATQSEETTILPSGVEWTMWYNSVADGNIVIKIPKRVMLDDLYSDCTTVSFNESMCSSFIAMLFIGTDSSARQLVSADANHTEERSGIKAHIQKQTLSLRRSNRGSATIATSQSHSCINATFVTLYKTSSTSIDAYVDILINGNMSKGLRIGIGSNNQRAHCSIGLSDERPRFIPLPRQSRSYSLAGGTQTIRIPLSVNADKLNNLMQPQHTTSFEFRTFIEQDECVETIHLKTLVPRIIDASQPQPRQAGYPLVDMWVLAGLTTSLPFEPVFNHSQATSSERNKHILTTLPVFKQDRFALLAVAITDMLLEAETDSNMTNRTAKISDLVIVNVRASETQASIVQDIENTPNFEGSDLRPDAIQDRCLHTHSGKCIVTHGITNGIPTTVDRVFEPPAGFCQRDTAAWTLTHATLTHFTRLEENAWGHHHISGYISHVCEFISETNAAVVFVSTPRVQWPPNQATNQATNPGDGADAIIVMVSARL